MYMIHSDSRATLSPEDKNFIVAKEYKLKKKIGNGSFGEIYLAINVKTNQEFAVKLESIKSPHPQLYYEYKVLNVLKGGMGIPTCKCYSSEREYFCIVMDLLGPSLEDLFLFCDKQFSLKTILMLADQMLSRIEYMHIKSFLHRDIKPDNFLMGIGNRANTVYIIDFGLSKRYKSATLKHIPFKDKKNLTGTARYASLNAHAGIEQSRRDDLESLIYVLIYFNKGTLPWQGLRAVTKKQKYERIHEKKLNMTAEELCVGCPQEFKTFFTYVRNLKFDECPDYMKCRNLIRQLLSTLNIQYDYIFDWTIKKQNQNPAIKSASTTNTSGQSKNTAGGSKNISMGPSNQSLDQLKKF